MTLIFACERLKYCSLVERVKKIESFQRGVKLSRNAGPLFILGVTKNSAILRESSRTRAMLRPLKMNKTSFGNEYIIIE